MRFTIFANALLLIAMIAPVAPGHAQAPADNSAAAKAAGAKAPKAAAKPAPPIQSGIFGYSGAKMADSAPKGVIGECIWIYDADNKQQVSKGDCLESDAGNFRVALAPGHYVVRGPGGNQKVEIKPDGWVKVTSIVKVPAALF